MSFNSDNTHTSPPSTAKSDASDVLWGAAKIGEVINRTPRQAFRLLETGSIPGRKVGRKWTASRRQLLRHLGIDEAVAG